jgi:heat shock protein HtpX
MNNVKVFALMAGLSALAAAVGKMLGGTRGALVALGLAAAMNLFLYWGSARVVLKSYGAKIVTPREAPDLYDMVNRLRLKAGLPMPRVAIAPQMQPNAFATGRSRDRAVICVTQGLLELVNHDELEGVLAHELAHIRNRDMLLQTLAATMAAAVSSLAHFALFFGRNDDQRNTFAGLAMLVVGPTVAVVLQFAISRQREFRADAVGAAISGNPHALAGALAKIERQARRHPMDISPAAASLAIINPLAAFSLAAPMRWFSTHPSTAERIFRLEAMAL